MILSKQVLHHVPIQLDQNSLIIDIETTGFSPKFASIYMIGLIYFKDDVYTSEQWLCEKDSDEYELLFKFNQRLESTPTLYQYNGDQFDLPFIKKRMALYKMTCKDYVSKDLLKVLRPYKKALNLDNLKLKTIEAYFGYKRQDPFTGGDLIPVYKNFLDSQSLTMQKDLLRHNYEDLLGLMGVLEHLPLFLLFDDLKERTRPIDLTYSTIENDYYVGKWPINLNHTYHLTNDLFTLDIDKGMASIRIPITVTTLYYHFPDYKDYYYLINEDYAIHKSVGQFVAKDHRIPATKKNAYIKKEGFFLPALLKFDLPFNLYYRKGIQDLGYVSVEDLVNTNGMPLYLQALLSQL